MRLLKTDKEKKRKYQVLTIMANGFGKRTDISSYKVQGRGGSGIKTAKQPINWRYYQCLLINAVSMEDRDLIIISEKDR